MSRKILICAVGVGLLAVACSEVYACSSPPPPPPQDPIARINGSTGPVTIYACKDSTVIFDGSGSNDPDGGSIEQYHWDLDEDGNFAEEGETGEVVSRSYSTVGSYTVKLKVQDNEGAWSIEDAECTVTVVKLNLTAYKRNGAVVSDDDEDTPGPGAYVADNSYDDDDVNGIEDKDTDIVRKGGVTKENDMIKVHFGFDGLAGLNTGKVVIRHAGCIKLWKHDYKGEEIEFTCVDSYHPWYEKVYDLSDGDQKVAFENDVSDKDLWLEGRCSALGVSLILKYTTANDELVCSDRVKVVVISAWLEVYKRDGSTKVAIDKELDPGAYVAYNNDDDDVNGILDKDTDLVRKDGVPKEDDTIKALFSLQHQCQNLNKGKVVLKRDNAKIRLWKEEYKSKEIVFNSAGGTEKVYDFSVQAQKQECLDDLYGEEKWRWIEGSEASGSLKDTGLTLIYKDGADVDVLVEPVNLTVVEVDLDMDGVAEDEETHKGGFIALNDDDDDDNHTADKDENGPITASGAPGSYDEDNLVKITLQKVKPTALTGDVTLKATAGGAKVKVWTASTKGTEVTLPKTYSTPSDLPKELYVEGYGVSGTVLRDITLALEYTVEGNTFADKVKLTVIDVQTILVDGSDTTTHEIESVLDASDIPDDHFVTVKGTGDIILNTTITPDTAETQSKISWSGVDSWLLLESEKSRATSNKYPGTVNVLGKTAKRFTNWVVWSTCNTPTFTKDVHQGYIYTGDEVLRFGLHIAFAVSPDYTFTITPGEIITDSDKPDLDDDKSAAVPGATQNHVCSGVELGNGANKKWDISRRIRIKVLNPHLYTKDELQYFEGHFYDAQPVATNVPEDYPSNEVIGNDDFSIDYEDNNPYDLIDEGELTAEDIPKSGMAHTTGEDGDTFEIRSHFGEFARLQLGSNWYRISDFSDWKVHAKFKRVDGEWEDDGSFADDDNDGWE